MDALILAGALNEGSLRQVSSAKYEAEIEIAGRPMLEYVIAALEQVSEIERIVVVGHASAGLSGLGQRIFHMAEPGTTLIDSLENGLKVLQTKAPVLVLTSDIPMVTSEAVSDFINHCQQVPGDIHYSFVSKKANEHKYPGVRRTYVKLREGVFTGGNVVRLSPEIIGDNLTMLRQAVALRKQPLKLCRMLGFKYLGKLLLGCLTIAEIEARVEQAFGFKAVGVVSDYPEIGVDVDKPSDWELAVRELS